jgi:TusA-related sulfurtransferase
MKVLKIVSSVLTLLVLILIPLIGFSAQFQPGHIFVWDAVWADSDLIEFDQTGTFIRSFKSTLPSGYAMNDIAYMRWGPDGHLYVYGELKTPMSGDWREGVFEWDGDGSLIQFHERGSSAAGGSGFEMATNGNFYVVDINQTERVKEWDRSFTTYTPFTYTDPRAGDEEAIRYGNNLFVTGPSYVVKYDVNTYSQIEWFPTSTDNNRINVSKDGILAVNQQWHSDTDNDFIELYDTSGALVGTATMPDVDWTTSGLAFDDNGWLYVVSNYFDGVDWKPQVVVFDDNYNYHHVLRPSELHSGSGTIAIARTSPIWQTAYNTLFDSPSYLELLRQYRDKVLSKTTEGEMYKTLLYMRSEEALEVLLDNPELMLEVKNLIEANKDAVLEVQNSNEGVKNLIEANRDAVLEVQNSNEGVMIYNTNKIISFLDAYAKESPPALKILANMVKWDMLRKQRQGKLFLGFELK